MSRTDSGLNHVKTLLPEDLEAEIEAQLEYGDSKSAWIREACEKRLSGEFDGDE